MPKNGLMAIVGTIFAPFSEGRGDMHIPPVSVCEWKYVKNLITANHKSTVEYDENLILPPRLLGLTMKSNSVQIISTSQ